MLTLLILAGGLVLILASCVVFTNAVESLGKQHKLGHGAVGSILAGVGTALPETIIPILALVVSKDANAADVGIGAIAGAPFMLGTLAFAVTGAAVYAYTWGGRRHFPMHADVSIFERDLSFFLVAYGLAVACTFVPSHAFRVVMAFVLLGIYAWYVKITLKCGEIEPAAVEPLYLLRLWDAGRAGPGLQAALALAGILGGAELFIEGVIEAAQMAGISPLILSIIITPIATELPEKFNSITWMRHKKDTLALGNITGAMVFQSSILPAIGIFATPWHLNAQGIASIIVALLASFVAWAEMTVRKRLSPYSLLVGGVLYLLYPLFVFVILPRL